VDMQFYKTFWGLQKLFVQRELVHKPLHWKELVEGVPLLFSAFASQGHMDDVEGGDEGGKKKEKSKKAKKDRGSKGSSPRSSSGAAAGATAVAAETAAASATITNESYFAKFLTSSHLMSLELRDPHFRRHILVQVTPASLAQLPIHGTDGNSCLMCAIAAADFFPASAEPPRSG
jgi:THO complex subunit 1